MNSKKIITNILIILLILDIPFILYSFNFNKTVFDNGVYKKEFEKYNVYDRLDNYDIEKINNDVLNYLKYKNTELNNNFFNQREKTHLKDVKDLVQLILFLFYFSIALFFVLLSLSIVLNKKNLKKIIKNIGVVFFFSGILTFLDAFVFWLIVKLNFDFAFGLMHKIFFKEGTYVFDLSFENIVVLYPQGLFYDVTVKVVLDTLVFSLVLFLVGLSILVYNKKIISIKKSNKKDHLKNKKDS